MPLTAIMLAFLTREVIVSLSVGIFALPVDIQ